jgi:hypothetical protein
MPTSPATPQEVRARSSTSGVLFISLRALIGFSSRDG